MSKKLTQEEFIKRAIKVHGEKYDYSPTMYCGSLQKVYIKCPKHGEYSQVASEHLRGRGCPKCGKHKTKPRKKTKLTGRLVYGVGVNDLFEKVIDTNYYKKWICMLNRCYHPTQYNHSKSYRDVSVCKEWLILSNFKRWFENPENGYQEGYQLDKDILVKGNKEYAPDKCCFVPREINDIVSKHNYKRKKNLPVGVVKIKQKGNKCYRADIGRRTIGYFYSIDEAFFAYKKEKETRIKNLAKEYLEKGKITQKVYNALNSFNIKITD